MVRFVIDKGPAQVKFHSTSNPSRKTLLCKLHLKVPSLSGDGTVSDLPNWFKCRYFNTLGLGRDPFNQNFGPVRPGKEVHLKRWSRFFETFPVGPNRSIEFWTEISGNFG